jgi:hypothetical protein
MFYRIVPLMLCSTVQPHSCYILQNSPIYVMFYRIVPLMLCSKEQSNSCYVLQNNPTHVMFYRTVPFMLCSTEQSHLCYVLQNSLIHVMFYRIVPLMLCSTVQPHACYVLQNSPIHVMFYKIVPLIHASGSKSDTNNLKTYIIGLVQMSHHSCSQHHYSLLDIYSHVLSPPSPQLWWQKFKQNLYPGWFQNNHTTYISSAFNLPKWVFKF